MIITESRSYQELKKDLDKNKKIGIVTCNACARFCKTGGKKGMKELAQKLEKDGFEVVDQDLIGSPCMFNQLQATKLRGEITIALACDSGLEMLREVFSKEKIIPGLKTIGIGKLDKDNKPHLVVEVK